MNRKDGNKINSNLIYVVSFILITLISLGYKLFLSGTTEGLLSSKDDDDLVIERADDTEASVAYELTESYETSPEVTPEPSTVSVYICGEVNSPGVYEVTAGSIINDVVQEAGGFTDQAASERLNLVYVIDSNISIYIPGEDEVYEQSEIIRSDGETIWGQGQSQSGQDEGSSLGTAVNINTATLDQLMTLPGIGQVTAQAIIDYREITPFTTIDDIMNVSGIGEAKFNRIREFICV